MGLFRLPVTKDTTISNYSNGGQLGQYGNAGQSQILDVWGNFDITQGEKFLTRFLMYFPVTSLSAAISNGTAPNINTDTTVTATLKVFNINHSESQAYDFNLQAFPITTYWAEGMGTRIDSFSESGVANWVSASVTAAWTTTGGDYLIDSNSASQYFSTGFEDLAINIKPMLLNWYNGISANNGLIVKMDSTAESTTGTTSASLQYYRKSFNSRTTNFLPYAPYVEIVWNNQIKDYRKIAKIGTTSNLFFYNFVNGVLTDVDSSTAFFPGSVTLSATTAGSSALLSTCVSLATLTSSTRLKAGVYSVNFTLPNSATTYNTFYDTWTITSSSSAASLSSTLSFSALSPIGVEDNMDFKDVIVKVINLRNSIPKDQIIVQKLFIRDSSLNLAPLVISSTAIPNTIVEDGAYRIKITNTGITDLDWTPLDFDKAGNFFTINASNFIRDVRYNVEFKLNIRGQTLIFSDPQNYFIVQ